jgi:hypothetical protein
VSVGQRLRLRLCRPLFRGGGGICLGGWERKVGVFRVVRALLMLVMRECTGPREGTCYKSP